MVTQSELPMRKWVYRFVVATMYFNAGLIPWYILMVNLGLKNNFLLYILPSAVGAYYVVLSKTYIESIPASVEESAKIDGAGRADHLRAAHPAHVHADHRLPDRVLRGEPMERLVG